MLLCAMCEECDIVQSNITTARALDFRLDRNAGKS